MNFTKMVVETSLYVILCWIKLYVSNVPTRTKYFDSDDKW